MDHRSALHDDGRADTEGFALFSTTLPDGSDPAFDRFAFLAGVSEVLASSLDYQATLASVAAQAVPVLADWCSVDVLDEAETLMRVATAHVDPRKADLIRDMQRRYPLQQETIPDTAARLRRGEPLLLSTILPEMVERVARGPEHLAFLREMAPRSLMVVPLVARSRTLGALTFIAAESGRVYDRSDLALAQDLARRAAVAVDNARLYEEAQAALRTRDEFLSLVSHDLRSPITSIKGMAQLLQRRAQRLGAPAQAQFVDGLARIDASTTKMTKLIEELLDLARLQAGRTLELDQQPVDLVSLARGVVETHQQSTTYHQLQLQTAEATITGAWDASRLERVLANLLGNAIKYSPTGGPVTVTLRREPAVAEDEGWALLSVIDQGVGIPAADLPRIFERFHRGRNVTGRIKGSGIGLSGARQIVEQHGGTISAESREGHGTTITLRLPLF